MNTDRYIKQVQLKTFGESGQQALANASVLVVGAGGLGIPVTQYLNAMGIGKLGIIDGDLIEVSNLHRQPAYGPDNVGHKKVEILAGWLKSQNPETQISIYDAFLSAENALELFRNYQLIVDATDNLATRYLIDDACVIMGLPWIYGALHGFEGQVSVFNFEEGPTYRCVFPNLPKAGEIPDCNTMGTLGVLPGIIGNFQALEAVKVLSNLNGVLSGKIMMYNGLHQEVYYLKAKRSLARQIPDNKLLASNYYCEPELGAINLVEFLEEKIHGFTGQIIDVREPFEFEEHAVPNAINVPLLQLDHYVSEIKPSTHLVFICKSGSRSRQAHELMKSKYPQHTSHWLTGGMMEYKKLVL